MFQDTLDIDANRMRSGSAKKALVEKSNGDPPQQQLTNSDSKIGNILRKYWTLSYKTFRRLFRRLTLLFWLS